MSAPSDHPTPGSVLTIGDLVRHDRGELGVVTVIEGDRLKIATLNDTGFRGDFVNRFTFVPQPLASDTLSGAEGVEAAVERLTKVALACEVEPEHALLSTAEARQHGSDLRTLLASHAAGVGTNMPLGLRSASPAEAGSDGQAARVLASSEGKE
ncbi:MAG: hypothetical protein EON59_11930 [Alphaproteobacteria bacterium]|nr:MAG: hypothetical protein EON59_11930 [Alphaproteobacteria bacterium]